MKEQIREAILKYGVHFDNVVKGKACTRMAVSTMGADIRVFGKMNFQILELINCLMKMETGFVDLLLSESKLPGVIVRMMTLFTWHNLSHNSVSKIFEAVLKGDYPLSREIMVSEEGLFSVFNEVLESGLKMKKNKRSQKGYYKGFLGHLKKISKLLLDSDIISIQEKLKESKLPILILLGENWRKWRENYYDEQIEMESRDLGGVGVRQTAPELESTFDFSVDDIRARFQDFLNPTPAADEESEDDGDTIASRSTIGERNVDEWLKGILPTTDEVEDITKETYDPNFDSQIQFNVENQMKLNDLLAELNL